MRERVEPLNSGAGDEGAQELRVMVFIVLTFTEPMAGVQGENFRIWIGEAFGCRVFCSKIDKLLASRSDFPRLVFRKFALKSARRYNRGQEWKTPFDGTNGIWIMWRFTGWRRKKRN